MFLIKLFIYIISKDLFIFINNIKKMTFSSRTVGVRCKTCNHGIMEIYYGDKIYGPYQKIAHTSRSDHTERNWLDRETIFYHHIVDNDKGCDAFLKLIGSIH